MSNQVDLDLYFTNDERVRRSLRAYFGRVRKGDDTVIKTNFGGKDTPSSQILDAWADTLEAVRTPWPSLWEFENDLRKKVGPMSVMLPLSDRMQDLDSYYESILLDSEPIDPRAVDALEDEWSVIRGLRIAGQGTTVDRMRLSTNSGSPYFTKRRKVRDISYPASLMPDGSSALMYLPDILDPGETREWEACAVLGWRGQEGGPLPTDVKQRVIWMFPFSANICELSLYNPLIAACQARFLVPAWIGMEQVDARITALFDTKGEKDQVICTDFSAFDQHFNRHCSDVAKTILRYLMVNSPDSDNWLETVFPIKYMIPIMYDEGLVRTGNHGMASGSGGTNADETILHRSLQYEAALKAGKRLNPNSQCLGDDGLLSYPGIEVEDVVKSYSAHGLEMNPSKQSVSRNDCTYLRRWHHKDYRIGGIAVGVYSTFRALGRLMYMERYYDDWSYKLVALRQLSIIENCKYHPLREQFADFCMKRDAYRLGLDIPGFLESIEYEALVATDHMPDLLGYTKSTQTKGGRSTGIGSWWIVNYLRSKQ